MSADPRWLELKKKAEKDASLNDGTHRFLVGLIDRLAKTPRQMAGDPFILSWRVVQNVTGGSVRGVCKKQAYRYIRALTWNEKKQQGYIFETPKEYVRDFLVGKQSYNPAAVKYFNFTFKSIKGARAEKAADAKKWADETRKTLRSAD